MSEVLLPHLVHSTTHTGQRSNQITACWLRSTMLRAVFFVFSCSLSFGMLRAPSPHRMWRSSSAHWYSDVVTHRQRSLYYGHDQRLVTQQPNSLVKPLRSDADSDSFEMNHLCLAPVALSSFPRSATISFRVRNELLALLKGWSSIKHHQHQRFHRNSKPLAEQTESDERAENAQRLLHMVTPNAHPRSWRAIALLQWKAARPRGGATVYYLRPRIRTTLLFDQCSEQTCNSIAA